MRASGDQPRRNLAASAAAGAPGPVSSAEAPGGPSASEEAADADDVSIPPNNDNSATASSTPEAPVATNDNEPVAEDASDTQLVEDPQMDETPEAETASEPIIPEPANDNQQVEDLPATGTEWPHHPAPGEVDKGSQPQTRRPRSNNVGRSKRQFLHHPLLLVPLHPPLAVVRRRHQRHPGFFRKRWKLRSREHERTLRRRRVRHARSICRGVRKPISSRRHSGIGRRSTSGHTRGRQ